MINKWWRVSFEYGNIADNQFYKFIKYYGENLKEWWSGLQDKYYNLETIREFLNKNKHKVEKYNLLWLIKNSKTKVKYDKENKEVFILDKFDGDLDY